MFKEHEVEIWGYQADDCEEIYHVQKEIAPSSIRLTLTLSPADCKLNTLNTKRRLLELKTQFVPRSKHFSSRL